MSNEKRKALVLERQERAADELLVAAGAAASSQDAEPVVGPLKTVSVLFWLMSSSASRGQ